MDENTIFQGAKTPEQNKKNEPPVAVPLANFSKPPAMTVVPTVDWQKPPQSSPKQEAPQGEPPRQPTFSFLAQLLKIILVLLVLIGIGFAVYRFLPALLKGRQEKVTLTYWGLWEDQGVMQVIITDFQKQHPDIIIKYSKEDSKQYRERLLARSDNSLGPDVFRFHNTWFPQLSTILLPLSNDVITKEEFQKSFYPVVQSDLVKNGAIYGIPLEIDTLSLFVNTDILQAAGVESPTTWDEFIKIARELTVKDETGKIKTSGAALGTFDNITHAPDIISLLFAQNGANNTNLSATQNNASDALDFYTSFAKGEGNVWNDTLDSSINAFAKGSLGMYFGYSYDVFTIRAINPQLPFQIVPVPHLPGRTMTIASYWVEGVSAKSKHKREAFLFLSFLAKKETAQKLFNEESKTRLFGEPYARVDLADTVKDNTFLYPFIHQAKDAASSFFAGETYDNGFNSQMNGYLGNAVRAVLTDTSPQSAVETLQKGVAEVLKQYDQQ